MNPAFQNCPDVFKPTPAAESLPASSGRIYMRSFGRDVAPQTRLIRNDGLCPWGSAKPLASFQARGRGVTLLTVIMALILALSLVCGCAKENKDLSKLEEENRVLKEKLASLEGQMKSGIASKPEVKEELLALARKLKTSPNDFVGQQIKLHCRFGGFENKFLDDTNGPKFLSTYYVGLIAQSGKEIDEPLFDHLFVSKKEAKEQGVYRLGVNDLITVYGIVNSAYNKEPWIEVYVVKTGWE
jgi:hypothetical protein